MMHLLRKTAFLFSLGLVAAVLCACGNTLSPDKLNSIELDGSWRSAGITVFYPSDWPVLEQKDNRISIETPFDGTFRASYGGVHSQETGDPEAVFKKASASVREEYIDAQPELEIGEECEYYLSAIEDGEGYVRGAYPVSGSAGNTQGSMERIRGYLYVALYQYADGTFDQYDVILVAKDSEFSSYEALFGKIVDSIKIEANPNYEPGQTYNVTFTDGQGNTIEVVQVGYEGTAKAPDDPKRDGYVFRGWTITPEVSGASIAGDLILGISSDITVEATWEEAFTVTFVGEDGSVLAEVGVRPGETSTTPVPPEKPGYTFAGWSPSVSNVQQDMTVQPTYEKNPSQAELNAVDTAKSYLDYKPFSYQGLIEQLEYEKYTHDEAVYGADHCGANWEEQAAKLARDYLDYKSFSRQGLIDQLVYEGFSPEEATFGVDSVGL